MIRASLVSLLAIAACSKGEPATPPASTNGSQVATAKAGSVVELGGKVTATRAGATRDLAPGADVFADDLVATSSDGRVTISLVHNNARWSLGANRTGKVSESVAWTLPKADAVATTVGDTSAAGRNAERSAADTAASAQLPPTIEAAAADDKKQAPDKTADKPVTKQTTGPTTGSTTGKKTSPKDATRKDELDGIGGAFGDELGGTGGLTGSGPGGGGGGGIGTGGLGGVGVTGKGGSTGGYGTGNGVAPKQPQVTAADPTVSGSLDKKIVTAIVRRHFGAIRYCYEQALQRNPSLEGTLKVKFVIGRDGKVPTASVEAGFDASVDSCVAGRFKNMEFPAPETGIVTVIYPIAFKPTQD